jgi:hypothetical protein
LGPIGPLTSRKIALEGNGLNIYLPKTITILDPTIIPDIVIPQPAIKPEESWAVYGGNISEIDDELIMSDLEDNLVLIIKLAIL